MTIGDFSRATRLTAKALRFYHRTGVLAPAHIDADTGYRLYAPDQLADAQTVRALRTLDVPVDVIREVLTTPDVAVRTRLIARHLDSMEHRFEETRRAVEGLRGLLEQPTVSADITHRRVPESRVVAVRAVIELADLRDWFTEAVATLRDVAERADPATVGAFGGLWSNDLFADERGEAMLFVAIADGFDERLVGGSTTIEVLPAAELAVAVHDGPDETVPRVYAALGAHVARHELSVDGPVRETYLSGFPGLDDRSVVEIGWPIFRVSR